MNSVLNTESPDTRHIGQYEVRVDFCQPTPESRTRFERRAETLADWLLERWEAERREEQHDDARAL